MPKLVSISFTTSPRLPGMHGAPLSFEVPVRTGPLTGWKIAVRPEVILLRSPAGWRPGDNPRRRTGEEEAGKEVTVYEIRRDTAALVWSWEPGESIGEVTAWDEDVPQIFGAPAPEGATLVKAQVKPKAKHDAKPGGEP